jgi:hypothetical protein
MSDIPVNSGTLPGGFCPTTYQEMVDGFSAVQTVTLPSSTGGITISATKPSTTTEIWFQIDSLGRFLRTYLYGQGAWLSAHPLVPGETVWWFGPLPNFQSFDGGDANSAGSQSGPMWQQAKDSNGNVIAAQFAVTAGTLPSGAVLQLGNTGGEESHLLTPAEAGIDPRHQHAVARANSNYHQIALPTGGTPTSIPGYAIGGSGDSTPSAQADYSVFGASTLQTDLPNNPQTVVPHNTMPPYVVGYLIQRTSRLFYAVT